MGVHNPKYIVALLESSIDYMENRPARKAGETSLVSTTARIVPSH
jgi:hypothetical protein